MGLENVYIGRPKRLGMRAVVYLANTHSRVKKVLPHDCTIYGNTATDKKV